MLVSNMLLVKRLVYSGTATQAHLPSMPPSSGVVRYWCMFNVFDGLCFVKCLLTGAGLSTGIQSSELTDLGGMVGSELIPVGQRSAITYTIPWVNTHQHVFIGDQLFRFGSNSPATRQAEISTVGVVKRKSLGLNDSA